MLLSAIVDRVSHKEFFVLKTETRLHSMAIGAEGRYNQLPKFNAV